MPRPRNSTPGSSSSKRRPTRHAGGANRPARFVAFLRGVNVGRAKRIAMADLRALVATLGYTDVQTLLNSGNVVFAAPPSVAARDPAARIEQALARTIGASARVVVLTADELEATLAANPLAAVATDPSRHLVAVLGATVDRGRLEAMAKQTWTPEAMALGPRVAYLWCAGGILTSPLWAAINRDLGQHTTSRNWTTMVKLGAMMKQP